MTMKRALVNKVLDYWIGLLPDAPIYAFPAQAKRELWFKGTPAIDQEITERFGRDLELLENGELDDLLAAGEREALAGIIIMDQFSRNIHRGASKAFALDAKALHWSKFLISCGKDRSLRFIERYFVYMPFMHSETLADQDECVRLAQGLAAECEALGPEAQAMSGMLESVIKFAQSHRAVVARWGRFPHRNAILGRANTPEEIEGFAKGSIPKW